MFQFNAQDFNASFWDKEKKLLDDSIWNSDEFRLKPLSNEPFDFLIPSSQQIETTSTSISSSQEESIQHDNDNQDINDQWTQPVLLSTHSTTLSWDKSTSQIATPFITEASLSIFEPILRDDSLVIHEAQLVQYLIQAINGTPSIYFYWHHHQLTRHENVRILGVSSKSLEPVIDRILLFGSQLKQLEQLGQHYQQHPDRYGLTGVSFGSCLIEFHFHIQYTIMTEIPTNTSILHLQQWVDHLFSVVERLCQLCQDDLPFGVGILNLLYQETKQLDLILNGSVGLYRDVCISFLSFTSLPFIHILNQWLHVEFIEDVHDPYHEFFISIDSSQKEIQKRYQVLSDTVLPFFINREFATYILGSGVSLRLLKKTQPNHVLFHSDHYIPLQFTLDIEQGEKLIEQLEKINHDIQSNVINVQEVVNENDDNQDEDVAMKDDCKLLPIDKEALKDNDFSRRLKELVRNEQKESIPNIDLIIQTSFIKSLEIWCPLLNKLFMKSLFSNECQLEYHLSILYQYYLLGNGIFSYRLESILISNQPNVNLALRDLIIESSLSNEDEYITLKSDKVIELDFRVKYPINIVLTKKVLEKYNRIFQFLQQIIKLNGTLKQSFDRIKQINHTQLKATVYKYRFELHQFMIGLTTFIKTSVIESTWIKFTKNLQQCTDLNQFNEYHELVLDCILYQCFLKKNQIKVYEVLQPIFKDIVLFCQLVEMKSESAHKFKKIMDQFRIHTTIFLKVLSLLESKGSGRLSNILNTPQQDNLDVFVKDLSLRLNLNQFYI